jgi:hypothetical protein
MISSRRSERREQSATNLQNYSSHLVIQYKSGGEILEAAETKAARACFCRNTHGDTSGKVTPQVAAASRLRLKCDGTR